MHRVKFQELSPVYMLNNNIIDYSLLNTPFYNTHMLIIELIKHDSFWFKYQLKYKFITCLHSNRKVSDLFFMDNNVVTSFQTTIRIIKYPPNYS